ncbi:ABC transporter ATP-binding protein/permease [Mesosutterella sp. AGMB02718]|uniref:ABC transporter ATP-binding protein/permease n=1 Tax=Mesosutterella faecium TaxID=2925194 RepID=A0ABT7INX5_9BURK|nr:ABC transporter ATP-binding protein/permease [Mesosutterella sp. AGMB02718]MDL2060079.1 ABC transporter ATP-binding protein/permease [Mesosutterella sp. AGMB02718]
MKTLRYFFRLAAPYWGSPSRWYAWAALAAVVGFAMGIIEVGAKIARWNKAFYDALANYNAEAVPGLIAQYLLYIAVIVFFVVTGNWIRKKLLFDWRTFLTRDFERRWLSGHRHYLLRFGGKVDNPDQRIAEDALQLADQTINLVKYFLMNLFKLFTFVAILWEMSGMLEFTLAGRSFAVTGYLVWIALVWSAFCTLLTHLVGRHLQSLYVEQQHREADFRAVLLGVRENAEQIASLGGERAEFGRMGRSFLAIAKNWKALIARELRLECFTASYLRITMFIPIIAVLPLYLARTMTFGDMMQARSAFMNVQDGFGWFMDYYKRIMAWAAVVQRLGRFEEALGAVRLPRSGGGQGAAPGDALDVRGLVLETPQGRVLSSPLSMRVPQGAWWMLSGPSGTGKSTLLRTLSGLWPSFSGSFALGPGEALFVPQKPYLPHDTLRAVLLYPKSGGADDGRLRAALRTVGLGRLSDSLDLELDWGSVLSGGEQQRVAAARILLMKPRILFIDEMTNQLDEASAREILSLLKKNLPGCSVIAVTHQKELSDLFEGRVPWRPVPA